MRNKFITCGHKSNTNGFSHHHHTPCSETPTWIEPNYDPPIPRVISKQPFESLKKQWLQTHPKSASFWRHKSECHSHLLVSACLIWDMSLSLWIFFFRASLISLGLCAHLFPSATGAWRQRFLFYHFSMKQETSPCSHNLCVNEALQSHESEYCGRVQLYVVSVSVPILFRSTLGIQGKHELNPRQQSFWPALYSACPPMPVLALINGNHASVLQSN